MSVITSVHADTLAARPDIEYALPPLPVQTAEAPLSWRERLWARAGVRKLFILALLALLWELAARLTDNDLLLPGAWQTAQAFAAGLASGELAARAGSRCGCWCRVMWRAWRWPSR